MPGYLYLPPLGQGLLLKRLGVPLRPDFKVCADNVLVFLEDLSQPLPELQLDLDRIAVIGAAIGRYFALCAATDASIKAYVSVDPFFSMLELAITYALFLHLAVKKRLDH